MTRRLAARQTALGAALAAAACRAPAPAATWVGSAACASCHDAESRAWRESQHAVAMQPANDSTVLGRFDDRGVSLAGVVTRFFRRDGKFFVNTEGPDGAAGDYEITHTFGVYPLQQYLVPFPGGRLQALGVAWDARPASDGGQRWYQLFPDARPGQPRHWTGLDQVWNYQCAECHATNLRKGYSETAGTYQTTWSEPVVGCEACHGPGSEHARRRQEGKGDAPLVSLRDATTATWAMDSATGIARRSAPRGSRAEVETCGRCHARRGLLNEDYVPGRLLAQTHRPALLEEGLYEADGQMRDEVYNYGSFVQSRMYRAGVTCGDCHDPHGAALPGDSTCARCHLPSRFAATSHHRHQPGGAGASCTTCHMPARTYMGVDRRHDHGFKVPRPDLTARFGIPSACTDCHRDRTADWAAREALAWYPSLPSRPGYAEAIALGRAGAPEGKAALERLISDTTEPAIARATAVRLLTRYGGSTLPSSLQLAVWDPDPIVRAAGADQLDGLDAGQAVTMGTPLLSDTVRLVRVAAARALAGARGAMSQEVRSRFDSVVGEYRASELVNADRPEARLNLGNLALTLGDPTGAEREYSAALRLDSTLVGGYVNLADLYRATGRDAQAEPLLRTAIARDPRDPGARQALGLLLVRLGRRGEALEALAEAATLAPRDPRAALIHGVARHDLEGPAAGIRVLEAAVARMPSDRALLLTLAGYLRDAGEAGRALPYAKRAATLDPGDTDAARMVRALESLMR